MDSLRESWNCKLGGNRITTPGGERALSDEQGLSAM